MHKLEDPFLDPGSLYLDNVIGGWAAIPIALVGGLVVYGTINGTAYLLKKSHISSMKRSGIKSSLRRDCWLDMQNGVIRYR